MDLRVDIAGIKLKNPVLMASGTAGYGVEISSFVDLHTIGGIVLKTITPEPRMGNPAPRVWETAAGMLNSIGLENVGLEAFIEEVLPQVKELGVPVVVSIAGETVMDFARMAARLDSLDAVSALEANVSCPNVEKGGIQFGVDAGATVAVIKAVCENSALPVFVKLSAAVSDVASIARASKEAGASGLSLINTLPGLAVDPATRKPRLGGVTGGLSGPAIKPVALKAVWDCFKATGIPIIGGGGIYDAEDALEFLISGAKAVAVGTATFQDPRRAIDIIEELPDALKRIGAESISELTGSLKV